VSEPLAPQQLPAAPTATCNTCNYFLASAATKMPPQPVEAAVPPANSGICRRHAPAVFLVTNVTFPIYGVWPTVSVNDWCGEYQAKA